MFAVVTRRYPGDFRRAIITLTFLGGLASSVFIPLTAWLIAGWGWRNALLVLAAVQDKPAEQVAGLDVAAALGAHKLIFLTDVEGWLASLERRVAPVPLVGRIDRGLGRAAAVGLGEHRSAGAEPVDPRPGGARAVRGAADRPGRGAL